MLIFKTALKVFGVTFAAAILLGLWFAFPDAQWFMAGVLAVVLAFRALTALMEDAVRKVLEEDLSVFEKHSGANREHIERIERMVTAILRDALDRRQSMAPRDS